MSVHARELMVWVILFVLAACTTARTPPEAARPVVTPMPLEVTTVESTATSSPAPEAPATAQRTPTEIATSRQAPYHPDPDHLWNRLFRHFYVRTAPDGTEYGGDALDPLLWHETSYLLEGESHRQAVALLDEFLAAHAEGAIADPLKRAMLQRDVWAVYDWVMFRPDDRPQQRRALQVRLAHVIRRLALTQVEIRALPDNYTAAVRSGVFPARYQPEDPHAAFLPPDLYRPDGNWLCLGREGGPIAMSHVQGFPFFGRSAFLVFIRVPGGREATRQYLDKLREDTSGRPQAVPSGTEVALVRRALLIDDRGEIRLSPLTESIQLRHFRSEVAQDFVEFKLSRPQLFAGDAGGLRPARTGDAEFPLFSSHGFDPFEGLESPGRHRVSALGRCAACHTSTGATAITGTTSILSYSRFRFSLPGGQPASLQETTPQAEVQTTIRWKVEQDSWRALRALWESSR